MLAQAAISKIDFGVNTQVMDKKKETSNPNTEPSQMNSIARATWTSQLTTNFCEVCVDEVLRGNRPTSHFTKQGWRNIEAAFKKNTGRSYTYLKFKNKWDTLKKDWIAWNKLKGSETGLRWDATKGTIAATDEWWERKLKEVPGASKFRERGLENLHLLDIMFRDTTATREGVRAPSLGVLPTNFETPKEGSCDSSSESAPPYGHDKIEILSPTQMPYPSQLCNTIQPPNSTQPTKEKGKKRAATFMQSEGKKGVVSKLIYELSHISNDKELKSSASSEISGSSIRDVMERVCTLDGVEKGSNLHLKAAHIFQKREKREMFVVIEEPHLQLMFLREEARLLGGQHFST
ncbi:L10-interacting MYB domain-containing protein-like isoform X2 [Corylus avellana]|uniref:L10-interacting MYB domain-containing protein-like isoform X2 n=1 Tax=Corylus avellana TaxID=13451 RepID=UPI00286C1608|nr:L10-interacting MYB domain-containing protein-like isoform X2 [Corylus avellana]XP_059454053.1 L10-interacting MYB domain-containing protein-like isoform X2 [Corylus avellana]